MKILKGFVVLLVIVISLIVIIVSCSDTEEEPAAEPEEVVEGEPEEVEEELQDNEALEQLALAIMQDNFEGMADIEFVQEEKTFYITPTDPAFTVEVVNAFEGDPGALEGWNGLVDSFKGMSETMGETLPGYWISLRNPVNLENVLLIVSDGSVIYNFIED